jgi:hypothetical protein
MPTASHSVIVHWLFRAYGTFFVRAILNLFEDMSTVLVCVLLCRLCREFMQQKVEIHVVGETIGQIGKRSSIFFFGQDFLIAG